MRSNKEQANRDLNRISVHEDRHVKFISKSCVFFLFFPTALTYKPCILIGQEGFCEC